MIEIKIRREVIRLSFATGGDATWADAIIRALEIESDNRGVADRGGTILIADPQTDWPWGKNGAGIWFSRVVSKKDADGKKRDHRLTYEIPFHVLLSVEYDSA